MQTLYYNGEYKVLELLEQLEDTIELPDHLGGSDAELNNEILNLVNNQAIKENRNFDVIVHTLLHPEVKNRYSRLRFRYQLPKYIFRAFEQYNMHPPLNYKNFICSFNGTPHVGRQLLVAILHKFKFFDSRYCSKNFSFNENELDGHIINYVGSQEQFYSKFFQTTDDFAQQISSFGFVRAQHSHNIYNLESKLTESFVHVVSETMATSYHPFVTEKFLYSVVTRGLFVAYGQPGWHKHLEEYYGFKPYSKIFDYKFDTIQNPVKRLLELVSMLSKFNILTVDEWNDLYQTEINTIEYNYNHYFSGDYLKKINEHG